MNTAATSAVTAGYAPIGAPSRTTGRNGQAGAAPAVATDSASRQGTGDTARAAHSVGRFISPVMEYDRDAHEVVVRHRDPANGKVVLQIPSEAALRQYEEAVRRADRQRQDQWSGASEAAKTTSTAANGASQSSGSARAANTSAPSNASPSNASPSNASAKSSGASEAQGSGSSGGGSVTAGSGGEGTGSVRAGGGGAATFSVVV